MISVLCCYIRDNHFERIADIVSDGLVILCCYIGENHFETIEDMVSDGLLTLFMEENHAEEYIDQGPKLARQPAVYTRRRSAHLMKYQATGQAPLKENTGNFST